MGFSTEIAAAAEIFANGLAEMWATRHGATTARPATAASDSRALIASLTDRAGALAARVTVPAARPGAAALKPGPFALGILADRRIRTADAVAR